MRRGYSHEHLARQRLCRSMCYYWQYLVTSGDARRRHEWTGLCARVRVRVGWGSWCRWGAETDGVVLMWVWSIVGVVVVARAHVVVVVVVVVVCGCVSVSVCACATSSTRGIPQRAGACEATHVIPTWCQTSRSTRSSAGWSHACAHDPWPCVQTRGGRGTMRGH